MSEPGGPPELPPIFQNETFVREYLELCRWPDGPVCPFCGKMKPVKPLGGESMSEGWYHCRRCRKKFTVRVGTILHRSKIPLHKWFLASVLIYDARARHEEINVYELHKRLEITYRSALLLLRRLNRDTGKIWWL